MESGHSVPSGISFFSNDDDIEGEFATYSPADTHLVEDEEDDNNDKEGCHYDGIGHQEVMDDDMGSFEDDSYSMDSVEMREAAIVCQSRSRWKCSTKEILELAMDAVDVNDVMLADPTAITAASRHIAGTASGTASATATATATTTTTTTATNAAASATVTSTTTAA
ncbi:hypothetical protein SEMRO_669_G184600.1 [Seminavis robusta]|uniref:Uncharacterized protein n=1 Tax=Seminavis robusta TaxID=568900 RepID=A0A9N8HJ56_9STRA|nr:hypothetical protein SEMRO_669_G184600.1 [Seminavis robusta]|eukprot:Sro669_g184600.1 n/a (167) ;mRNA; f:47241-47836